MRSSARCLALVLLVAAALLMGGCQGRMLEELFGPVWTWPSLETASHSTASGPATPATEPAQTTAEQTTTMQTAAGSEPLDFSQPTPGFDTQITTLLQEGMEQRNRSISLHSVFSAWQIRESQFQDAIDRIYDLFTDLYLSQPQFFYLNGSFQIYYSVLRGDNSVVVEPRLEPAYWSSTADLTDEELDVMIRSVNAVVQSLADQFRSETSQPHEQLVLIHDWLVQHIAYDVTGDQGNNHAGSALLQQITLCQGYAQSFQLIGQAMGFDVRIVNGTSEGIGHAWNQVVLDQTAYHIDVTHDDPTPDGGTDHPVRHVHLFRSDAFFSQTHQWEKDRFLPCPVDGAFYFRERGLVAQNEADLKRLLNQFLDGVDLRSDKTWLLEVLYEGTDLPDRETVDELLTTALQKMTTGKTVYYRIDLNKSIVVMQVSKNR